MATSRSSRLLPVSLIIASPFVFLALASSNAISLQWSNTSYGPDGPWQAVSIGLGTPTQKIDLFSGGSWTANILNTSVCPDSAEYSSSNTSLFSGIASNSYIQINDTGTIVNTTFASQAGALPMLSGNAHIGLDTLTISTGTDSVYINNFKLLVIDNADQALNNGTKYTP
ncbi:hypothetical protein EYC80_009060 [Monilinia laxa]|uniref:Uncharacterized protein n=1 Tax=Monilinia laxa TaxID=61186 RepID=A0A5N6K295_MONLA|nr:hypothetical protein EYC80_009060 [Monilinia laxa]